MRSHNRLAAVFSPTRRLLGAEQAALRAGGLLGGLEWVVPRADCRYRRTDFSHLPARQREPAARLASRRMEARPGARSHIAWTGGIAHAWTWPDAGERLGAGDAGWIPESLLRRPPAEDGLRLLQQVRGYEGQCWRDGILAASQWWPEVPGADAWRRFVRACGLPPGAGDPVPEPVGVGWSEPWGDRSRRMPASPALLERWAWMAGIGLLCFGLGWQLAGQAYWRAAQSRLGSRIDALRAQASPLLAARERADAARDALLDLQALDAGSDDYRLMAAVVAPLPEDARFASWQRDEKTLQVAVQSADTDPRHFVAAFAGEGSLSNVVATPGQGTMGLGFDLAAPQANDDAPAEAAATQVAPP